VDTIKILRTANTSKRKFRFAKNYEPSGSQKPLPQSDVNSIKSRDDSRPSCGQILERFTLKQLRKQSRKYVITIGGLRL